MKMEQNKTKLIEKFLLGNTSTQENEDLYRRLDPETDEAFNEYCRNLWDDLSCHPQPSRPNPPDTGPQIPAETFSCTKERIRIRLEELLPVT